MYQDIIKAFEIGKSWNTNSLERSRDAFTSIVLIVVAAIFPFFGIYFLSLGENVMAGFLFGYAFLYAGNYLFARRHGHYRMIQYAGFLVLHTIFTAMLIFLGKVEYSIILSMIMPVISVTLLYARRGAIVGIVYLVIFFACNIIHVVWGNNTAGDSIFTASRVFTLVVSQLIAWACSLRYTVYEVLTTEITRQKDNIILDEKKKTQEKDEFISELSYQVRTPLSNIIGVGNLLTETNLNDRQKDLTDTILASANNLVNVMNMMTSKVASQQIIDVKPSATVPFNLHDLLNSIVRLFLGASDDYNIAMKPNMEDSTATFEGDPVRLKQIFLTLILAIIRNKKSEKINLILSYRLDFESNNVTFTIRISDLIHLASQSEDMSYSIASHLIENMGGKLKESGDNYSVFDFTLPMRKMRTADASAAPLESGGTVDAQPTTATATNPAPTQAFGSAVDLKEARVLLVEDNLINQKIVILSIQKLVKAIAIANNGQEAVELFAVGKYDIVLMDIQMPVMDGLQATKKIREVEAETNAAAIPIIAITANALAGDREHCLASGMNEYISKPFQVEMLVSKMKALLAG